MSIAYVSKGAFECRWTLLPALENAVKRTKEVQYEEGKLLEYHDALVRHFETLMCLRELEAYVSYFESAKSAMEKYLAGEQYTEYLNDDDTMPTIYEVMEFYFESSDVPLTILSELSQVFCKKAVEMDMRLYEGFQKFFDMKMGDNQNESEEFERKLDQQLEAIETEGNFGALLERMAKAKEILKAKGDLIEVIKLMY